jgi:hypothetical protein
VVTVRQLLLLGGGLLALVVAAAVAFPDAVLSPGDLSKSHAGLTCFACHAPFRGPDARCADCHDPKWIASPDAPPFHFALIEDDCAACHTDHRGPAPSVREFRHDLLRGDLRAGCGACHIRPFDEIHAGAADACGSCHGVKGWKPATFLHDGFRFDRDHPATCRACHPASHASYTCYGCHEHAPGEVAEKHREMGEFEDCARCHRSGDEIEAEGGRGTDDGRRRRRGRGEDD